MSNLASSLQSFRAFVAFRFKQEVKMTKRTSVFFPVVMSKSQKLHLKLTNLGFHHMVVQKLPKFVKVYWNQ